jgi:hypothetical protein
MARLDPPFDGLGGPPATPGAIHIVGGGPGDPGCLTLLPVATAVVGAASDGLFGVSLSPVRGFIRDRDHWRASLKLGAVAWVVMAVVPLLAATGLSIALAAALWALAHRLRAARVRDASRQVLVAALALVIVGGLVLIVPAARSEWAA